MLIAATFGVTVAALVDFVAVLFDGGGIGGDSNENEGKNRNGSCITLDLPLLLDLEVDGDFVGRNNNNTNNNSNNNNTNQNYNKPFPFVQVMMLLGGLLFTIASILYLPTISSKPIFKETTIATTLANLGTWIFRLGTTSYLLGSSKTLYDIITSPPGIRNSNKYDTMGVVLFIVGAGFYFVGGVLSQLGIAGFAVTWIIGSIFFFGGAVGFYLG